MNLAKNIEFTKVLGYFGAAQTTRNSDIIDMSGVDGVVFIALFDTLIEAGTIKLSVDQNTANSASGMAELAGSTTHTVTAAETTGGVLVADVYRPQERYLRASIDIGTSNAVISGIVAIQYSGVKQPTTNTGATVLEVDVLVSPAEAA